MFTGIVEAVGRLAAVKPAPGGLRLTIDVGRLSMDDVANGDSIAVDGACLTVVAKTPNTFEADVSQETIACTAGFAEGAAVNLEKALRASDRLGGHLVSGHVDGVGRVSRIDVLADNRVVVVELPGDIAKYVARKGSVAVNGVSLTVNEVSANAFSVNLIPHTLGATSLGLLAAGARVNIEVDMLARYLERLLEAR